MKRLVRVCFDDSCCSHGCNRERNNLYFCNANSSAGSNFEQLDFKIEKVLSKVEQIFEKLLDSQKVIDKIEDTQILINDVVDRVLDRIDDDQLVLEAIDTATAKIERDQVAMSKNISKFWDKVDEIQFFVSSKLDEILEEVQKITEKTEKNTIHFE